MDTQWVSVREIGKYFGYESPDLFNEFIRNGMVRGEKRTGRTGRVSWHIRQETAEHLKANYTRKDLRRIRSEMNFGMYPWLDVPKEPERVRLPIPKPIAERLSEPKQEPGIADVLEGVCIILQLQLELNTNLEMIAAAVQKLREEWEGSGNAV